MFNYGGVRPHAINLVENMLSPKRTAMPSSLSSGTTRTKAPTRRRLYEGFVCFDLKPMRTNEADSVALSIAVREWANDAIDDVETKIYDVVYRYNQPAAMSRTEIPIPVISSNEYY